MNPILGADVPDVAVIRVGDAYYMSSTTMHPSPWLSIMKATGLVNWKLVSQAYDTLRDDALAIRNGKDACGRGSWASSLRHHDDTFHATTSSGTTGLTHICRTRDPEKDLWRADAFRPSPHDCGESQSNTACRTGARIRSLVCTEQACRRSIAGTRNRASRDWRRDHLGRGDDGA